MSVTLAATAAVATSHPEFHISTCGPGAPYYRHAQKLHTRSSHDRQEGGVVGFAEHIAMDQLPTCPSNRPTVLGHTRYIATMEVPPVSSLASSSVGTSSKGEKQQDLFPLFSFCSLIVGGDISVQSSQKNHRHHARPQGQDHCGDHGTRQVSEGRKNSINLQVFQPVAPNSDKRLPLKDLQVK